MTAAMPHAEAARAVLGDPLYAYLMGRAADAPGEIPPDANAEAFAQLCFVPRVLTGHASVDISTALGAHCYTAPLGIGAFAGDRVFHPEGLLPLAHVAAQLDLPLIVSEETVTPFAEITAVHRGCWLQLRAAGPLDRIRRLVDMAADSGAQGMVFTILAPTHPAPGLMPGGFSIGAEIASRGWTTIGSDEPGIANLPSFPAWGRREMADIIAHARLRGLPVILKGILHPDDARLAEEIGATAILPSAIGLRQSHRWATAPARLPLLRAATDLPVVLDGGVRHGSDIVAACALGAALALQVRPIVTAFVGFQLPTSVWSTVICRFEADDKVCEAGEASP